MDYFQPYLVCKYLSTHIKQLSVCLIVLLHMCFELSAQEIKFSSIDPHVISSSGLNMKNADGLSLFYTVGDLAIKHVRDGIKLSEGFHHTFFIITETEELTFDQLSIFPNPTVGIITIENPHEAVQFILLNNIGQFLQRGQIEKVNSIDLSKYEQGIYFLQLFQQNKFLRSYKVIKV